MATREITRLIVSMPPRHGKSELVSKYLPAWVVGALQQKVILTSYEADFAKEWSIKARQLMYDFGPSVFDTRVSDDIANADHWETVDGGVMYSAGVGGPLTGKGAHWLIIDDPVKNSEEADSATYRDKADDWFRSTAYTRLEPGAVVILMMTRWHEDDLVGRRLQEDLDGWTVVDFPAIAEDHDVLGRKPGDALWPERFSTEELKRIRATISSRWWYSMYQQSPTAEGGNKIQSEWWQRYTTLPDDINHVAVFWDTAWGTKASSDYSVAAIWGANRSGYYLMDLYRDRVEFPTLVDWAIEISTKYPGCIHVVEDAASGRPLMQVLKRDTTLNVKAQKVQTDKVSRLNAVINTIESLRCYIPVNAPWVHAFVDEHRRFPSGTHNDQVDTTSLCLDYMTKRRPLGKSPNGDTAAPTKPSMWTGDVNELKQFMNPWSFNDYAKRS